MFFKDHFPVDWLKRLNIFYIKAQAHTHTHVLGNFNFAFFSFFICSRFCHFLCHFFAEDEEQRAGSRVGNRIGPASWPKKLLAFGTSCRMLSLCSDVACCCCCCCCAHDHDNNIERRWQFVIGFCGRPKSCCSVLWQSRRSSNCFPGHKVWRNSRAVEVGMACLMTRACQPLLTDSQLCSTLELRF